MNNPAKLRHLSLRALGSTFLGSLLLAGSGASAEPERLDYASLPRHVYSDRSVVELLSAHFERRNLTGLEVLRGSDTDRLLLSIVTDTEGEVFRSITLATGVLELLSEAGHDEIIALELLMMTSNAGHAGQFLLTPEVVRPLLDGEIELPDFYVQHVRF